MKKFLIFIFAIVTFLSPIICLADDNYTHEDNVSGNSLTELSNGETMKNNYGIVTTNNGTIDFNHYHIETNNGTVKINKSIIMTNNGIVENNYSYNLITNNGTVINDYIMSMSDRNNLNAQNTFYLVDFKYLNNNIIAVDWKGPKDPLGDYYYGKSSNADEKNRGASFSVATFDEGYEIVDVISDEAVLTQIGENVYDISYDGQTTFSLRVEYLPVITEKATKGGKIVRTSYTKGPMNNYSTIDYEFIPDEGYTISNVLVNKKSIGSVSNHTLYDVETPTTIEVRFESLTDVPETVDNIVIWIIAGVISIVSLVMVVIIGRKYLNKSN